MLETRHQIACARDRADGISTVDRIVGSSLVILSCRHDCLAVAQIRPTGTETLRTAISSRIIYPAGKSCIHGPPKSNCQPDHLPPHSSRSIASMTIDTMNSTLDSQLRFFFTPRSARPR
ncbi:hypothetical protein BDV09DRAFT_54355 [Aspergillus tetrazonus]